MEIIEKIKGLGAGNQFEGFALTAKNKRTGKINYEIYVNVEMLWKEAVKRAHKNPEKKFIDYFAKTYTHELLHAMIEENSPEEGTVYGEEKVIFGLLDEKFYKYLEEYYQSSKS